MHQPLKAEGRSARLAGAGHAGPPSVRKGQWAPFSLVDWAEDTLRKTGPEKGTDAKEAKPTGVHFRGLVVGSDRRF